MILPITDRKREQENVTVTGDVKCLDHVVVAIGRVQPQRTKSGRRAQAGDDEKSP
ncbi:MAG TPA: hypothetical protein VGH74_20205 [Planctomycetaceae bacterium]